ncbi:prepilin peptidase [Desulfotignum balticum]|uniref:prepilin peptidase n=1 Tax=Desulfotignum balticum TaxID=115781 RepID=UPI0004628822|nr:A24 family peptidase [Desulfotignum balticum]
MTISMLAVHIFIFMFGACIGSFLNVCIYRIPRNMSIVFPGSACPACGHGLPFYANIPILSFLILKGRCLFCSHPISLQYVVVEIVTGMLAILTYLIFGWTPEALVWFAFAATLVVVSGIDLAFRIIPDRISIPGIFVFGILARVVLDRPLTGIVSGILVGGGILYGVALVYYLIRKTDGMGGGDIKLLAMIGAVTGVTGVLFTLFAGSFAGTGAGIAAMIRNRHADRRMQLPFGPFLSAGALVYVFFGDPIIDWYFLWAVF